MEYITPAVIAAVVITALIGRKSVYGAFSEGAADGLRLLAQIFPPLVAVLTAAAMLKASGAVDLVVNFISPLCARLGIPAEIMPLILIRPVSGSGAVGILAGILSDYGPDSTIGRMASVICGSTETTFYCAAVYFASTRVKSAAPAIICAMIADIAAIAAAAVINSVW